MVVDKLLSVGERSETLEIRFEYSKEYSMCKWIEFFQRYGTAITVEKSERQSQRWQIIRDW